MLVLNRRQYWTFTVCALIGVASMAVTYVDGHKVSDASRGGTWPGLWFGVAAWLAMVVATLVRLPRLFPRRAFLGQSRGWLRWHFGIGTLSAVWVWCHCGAHVGGRVEKILLIAYGSAIVTGIYGLVLQQWIPQLISAAFPEEIEMTSLPMQCNAVSDSLKESKLLEDLRNAKSGTEVPKGSIAILEQAATLVERAAAALCWRSPWRWNGNGLAERVAQTLATLPPDFHERLQGLERS